MFLGLEQENCLFFHLFSLSNFGEKFGVDHDSLDAVVREVLN